MTADPKTLQTFFFGDASRRLFGALALPPGGKAHTGIVVSPPFGEEMFNTYNRLSRWSKVMALEGFAVLRYHPYGTGDSDGQFPDFTLDGAVADLVTATERLRREPGLRRLGVLGVRFGAAVAVRAAPVNSTEFMAMWSPMIDLNQYFREILRFKLTNGMVHQQGDAPKITLKTMTQDLLADKAVDVVGYAVSRPLYEQMRSVTAWPDEPPSPRILVLSRPSEDAEEAPQISSWRERGADVRLSVVKYPVFWEDFRGGTPPELTLATRAWMAESVAQKAAS